MHRHKAAKKLLTCLHVITQRCLFRFSSRCGSPFETVSLRVLTTGAHGRVVLYMLIYLYQPSNNDGNVI